MAKDGTNRGGRRTRSGAKPNSLADKILAGKEAQILEFHGPEVIPEFPSPEEINGEDMPKPSDYLSARQHDGTPLGADIIFKETWLWLKERGCEKLVNPRLIESYAQSFARFIQCEEAISEFSLLSRHPTTGNAIASPFVSMSNTYLKQANLMWYEIFDIVKQNCTTNFVGNPHEDAMEQLLRSRKG